MPTPPSSRSARSLLTGLALLTVLAACGGDDAPDAEAYIDATQEQFAGDLGGVELTDDQSRCVAESIVNAADVDRLDDAGIDPDEFVGAPSFGAVDIDADPEQLRDDLTESLQPCGLGTTLAAVMVGEFPSPPSPEDEACLADALDGGTELASGVAAMLIDESDAQLQQAFLVAMAECPGVAGNLLADTLESAGVPVDVEARDCIVAEMGARGEAGVATMMEGGAAAEAMGAELGEVCLDGVAGLTG